MNWFKEHQYIAEWIGGIAAIVPLLIAIIQKHGKFWTIEWYKAIILITFAVSLIVLINPGFDSFARGVSIALLGLILNWVMSNYHNLN